MAISDLKARSGTRNAYSADFHRWSEEQARALRERRAADVDWENVAEEIETLGRSERSEIRSRMIVLLLHLLKWQFQPAKRKRGWEASILEARDQINEQLASSPSLGAFPEAIAAKQYKIARLKAADETGLPLNAFPDVCPYTIAEILDEGFLPGEAP